jgi:hypothetical protein
VRALRRSTPPGRTIEVTCAVGALLLALLASCKDDSRADTPRARALDPTTAAPATTTSAAVPPAAAAGDVTIVAAGDIACDPNDDHYRGGAGAARECHHAATADLAVAQNPSAVLLLGDIQYESGTIDAFRTSFERTWGRLKRISYPTPGNHEYVASAGGYFSYFGSVAGRVDRGYYSFDLGSWHLIALNSNCTKVPSGCGTNSAQSTWLRADLAAHPNVCTLAFWHHPRFSAGTHGNDPRTDRLWRALYDGGADVVLVAHNHDYERFAPMDPDGRADHARGIRQFVVGTGGRNLARFRSTEANSEARNADTFGVLRVSLHSSGYDWQFVPEPKPNSFTDSGSDVCH